MTIPPPSPRQRYGRRARPLLDFLGLSRSMVGMLGMVVLVGMGERMAERFLPLYLLALGGGPIVIGVLNGLDNLLSAGYAFLGGWLADRIGIKRSLFYFNLVAVLGFLIVILVPRWPAVLVGSVFFLAWTAISLPASMSLVARVLDPGKRTMGVSMHSLVRRVPMALGPILGGAFIAAWGVETGVRLAFGAAIIMALLAMLMQEGLIEADSARPGRVRPTANPFRTLAGMSLALRRLLIADILIRFCEQIPYAFVVVWATRSIAAPASELQFGLLSAIEMTTAMLIYVPVAWLADRGNKKPFVVATFCFFTAFPVVLLFSQSMSGLAFAFVIRGLKEFGEPTRKALIMDLAPEDQKASMFGAYYLARDLTVGVAAIGGGFLWKISPELNLLSAAAFGVLGIAWFAWKGSDARA